LDIRIATRKSALARWQAEYVATKLKKLDQVDEVSLVPLSTRGDEVLDRSLQKIGGKGLFIKELELAMQAGSADIAVHSMKDVPVELPSGFVIASVLERADPSDALVSERFDSFAALPTGSVIGSSSLRRQSQLLAHDATLVVRPLRGNVNTRLEKLAAGDYDAIVLASAGLDRLGFEDKIRERFAVDWMLPATAQGVIGIECLQSNNALKEVLQELNDPLSQQTTAAERAVARTLGADCQSPVACFASVDDGILSINAMVASGDGQTMIKEHITGDAGTDSQQLGQALAERMLSLGAAPLLRGQNG